MSAPKCVLTPTTQLVLLRVACDSVLKRFAVPQDKLDKLEAILEEALAQGWISLGMLAKVAGKCTSMSVAVPPASMYTHFM